MKKIYFILIFVFGMIIISDVDLLCGNVDPAKGAAKLGHEKEITLIIAYDNYQYKEGMGTAWGFSCIIEGTEKTVLFDTGGDGALLMRNIKELGITPEQIDVIVLSHIHGDHVGGVRTFLKSNPKVTVYVPRSFPEGLKQDIRVYGATLVEVGECLKICENMYSTGELGTSIKEQSLIIHTKKGLIVITGCAHPGIVKIIREAKGLLKDDVLFVLGGFHLWSESKSDIQKIVTRVKKLGVKYVGPCHCSGDNARSLFEKEYQENFIPVGVGKIIHSIDLR